MNKYSIVNKIDAAVEKAGIKLSGALSIDMPLDSQGCDILLYDMSYSNFSRKFIGCYKIDEDIVIR